MINSEGKEDFTKRAKTEPQFCNKSEVRLIRDAWKQSFPTTALRRSANVVRLGISLNEFIFSTFLYLFTLVNAYFLVNNDNGEVDKTVRTGSILSNTHFFSL